MILRQKWEALGPRAAGGPNDPGGGYGGNPEGSGIPRVLLQDSAEKILTQEILIHRFCVSAPTGSG